MTTSELKKKKLDLINWINNLSDEDTITLLDGLKNSYQTDWWDTLFPSQQDMINRGLNDAKTENVVCSKSF